MSLTHPHLVAEFHATKNEGFSPSDIQAGTGRKIWWTCSACGRDWLARGADRAKGSGCPDCARANWTPSGKVSDIPELVAQWHPTKNGDLKPENVSSGSGKKVWWKCPEGPDHEWPAIVTNRSRGRGCPYCGGKVVSVTNSLTRFPDLVAQWHPTKNGDVTPDQVVAGTNKIFWWKCSKGPDHEWKAVCASRVNGSGCPYCAHQKVSVTNSLARFPNLVTQWHPTKNGNLTPDQVISGTSHKVWWKCPKGPDHEWHERVAERMKGLGCPCCSNRKASVTNNFTNYPELAAQWHPTKNGGLRPEDLAARTTKKIWWKCPKGSDHEWQASGLKRVHGRGCPYCAGREVSETNRLSNYPDLVAQWHPTKNGDLTPDDVVAGSTLVVWWKCPEGSDHEWPARIFKRVRGRGCRCCAGLQPSVTNSLAQFPDLVAEWHPTLNGDLTPDNVVAGSHQIIWWKCPKGPDHEWPATAINRSRGRGCSQCAGQRVSVTNSLARFPNLVAEWHPTLNGNQQPETLTAGTNRKVWWLCPRDPTHTWQAQVSSRVKGSGCSKCAKGGYNAGQRGFLYLLTGDEWGKIGISNALERRILQHQRGGVFGECVFAAEFADGTIPAQLERELLRFIAAKTEERAPKTTDGYTESFPIVMLEDVKKKLDELLERAPEASILTNES
jgi:hypothetical protein